MLKKLIQKIWAWWHRKDKRVASYVKKSLDESSEARARILQLEARMRKLPGAIRGDDYPLKHSFADGCYIREMSAPAGHLIITKIHKITHPYFILKGECSILTEEGVKRIKAPYHGITLAGTKRVVFVHEDTIWVTVHVTKQTNLEKIEEEVIAKTFDEIPNNIIETLSEVLKIEEEKNVNR